MSYQNENKNFFGRIGILNLLKRRVIDLKEGYRQNIALVGNPYVGKSSLLQYFLSNLDDEKVIPVYLDLDHKDFSYFFLKFTSSLLFNFSKVRRLPPHENLKLLMESTRHVIPHTVDVIKKIQEDFEKGKSYDAFLGLMTLPEIFTNETGTCCILILDEFQNLEDFLPENVFQDLGKKIMTQKKCFYILVSSYPSLAQKIITEKLSLLFGNFEIVSIEPFDLKTSQEFIGHHMREIRIGFQLRNFLTDFTGGHPLYLNLICQELLNLSAIHKQNEIYMPLLTQAIEKTIFDRWGVLSRHFELIVNDLCSGKGNPTMSSILISLSNGKHKVEDLIQDLKFKKSYVRQKINGLLELGMIVKNGNVHYFKDKLFKYWIKFVYQKRLKDVELTPDKQQKLFKEELNQYVEEFKLSARQDFSSRIVDLLQCFDNESFDLNGRKYKLPLFREIKPLNLAEDHGNYFNIIQATGTDTSWLFILKKDNFSENDMNAVLKELEKVQEKPERCLIITLSDLDANAKLRALQERFWIWHEGELNTLLTLFDKPYILR